MAHPKIAKNHITFVDNYAEQLDLSPSQSEQLEVLEYQWIKNKMFSTNYNENNEILKYYRKAFALLTNTQQNKLIVIRKKYKEKAALNSIENRRLQRLKDKYQTLQLDDTQLKKLSNLIDEIKEIVSNKSGCFLGYNIPLTNKHQLYLKEAEHILSSFLNSTQIQQFIIAENEHEAWTKQIRLAPISQHYANLKLTTKQAEQIYFYEENEPFKNCNNKYLSDFEKWEIEANYMANILTPQQFKKYQITQNEREQSYVSNLKETNKKVLKNIQELKDEYEYIKNEYLPVVCAWRKEIEKKTPISLAKEIDKQRLVYKKYLVQSLDQQIRDNKRYYKSYVTNEKVYFKLHAKRNALLPNCNSNSIDFESMISKIPKTLQDFINIGDETVRLAQEKLCGFNIQNYEKHGGSYSGATYVIRQPENKIATTISILLTYPHTQLNILAADTFN